MDKTVNIINVIWLPFIAVNLENAVNNIQLQYEMRVTE